MTSENEELKSGLKKVYDRLDDLTRKFKADSKGHKEKYRNYATGIIALGAVTTIVAASGLVFDNHVKLIQFFLVILTASTTAIASFSEMRHFRELWQHEREIYHTLNDIRNEIEFEKITKNLNVEKLRQYDKKITNLLKSSTENWRGIDDNENKK